MEPTKTNQVMVKNRFYDKVPVPVQLSNLTLYNQEPISGTFGHVYCVTDEQGVQFALKIFLTPSSTKIQANDVDVSQRLTLVSDCNIASVIDQYREDISFHGFKYTAIKFKMEYISGGSVSYNLSKLGRMFNVAEAKCAGYQISKAVHTLHSCRILHRDLSLNNILMMDSSPFTLYKICDYGLSEYQPPLQDPSDAPIFNPCPSRPNDNHPAEIFHQYLNHSRLSVHYSYKIDSFGIGFCIWNMLYKEDLFTPVPREDGHDTELSVILQEHETKSYQNRDCYKTSPVDLQSLFDGCFNYIASARFSASQILCHRFFCDDDLREQLKKVCTRFPGKCVDLNHLISNGNSEHFMTIINDESPMPPIAQISPDKKFSTKLSDLLPKQIISVSDTVLAPAILQSVSVFVR